MLKLLSDKSNLEALKIKREWKNEEEVI